jgi:hypothetical protein
MSKRVIQDQLAEARRRIERLQASTHSGAPAIESDLRSWDAYVERLQTRVADEANDAREQAEAAIRDLRSRRIDVGQRFAQATNRRRKEQR